MVPRQITSSSLTVTEIEFLCILFVFWSNEGKKENNGNCESDKDKREIVPRAVLDWVRVIILFFLPLSLPLLLFPAF